MLKMEIVMNEDKIRSEGKYSLEKIYKVIDEAFAEKNLPKIEKGVYQDRNGRHDYADMGNIILWLVQEEWFMQNVSSFLWYVNDSVEDILRTCKRKKFGVVI